MMFACCGGRDESTQRVLKWDVNNKDTVSAIKSKNAITVETLKTEDVLVKVEFATITHSDKLDKPSAIGKYFSGTVSKIGTAPTNKLVKGDSVYGYVADANTSAVSEWVVVPSTQLAKIPAGIDSSFASALPLVAQWAEYVKGAVAKDQKVIIKTNNKGVETVISNFVKANTATVVKEKKDGVNHIIHLGGECSEEVDEKILGYTFAAKGKYQSATLIDVEKNWANLTKFVADNAASFKGVGAGPVKEKAALLTKLKELAEAKLEFVAIDVEGLKAIEEKPVEPSKADKEKADKAAADKAAADKLAAEKTKSGTTQGQ